MDRSFALRRTLVALVAVAAACSGYDGTSPYPQPPADQPPLTPPPSELLDGLWTSSGSDPALLRLGAAQLAASGIIPAGTTVTTGSASLFTLNSIAFDDAGTMWVASQNDSLVLGFAAGLLETTGAVTATSVIEPVNGSLAGPTGVAFDRERRLWVASSESGTLVRYDGAQLAEGGPQAPSVTLTGVGRPTALAFDESGALWVSDNAANRLAKYGPGKLAGSGAPEPDVTIGGAATTLETPAGLAFDFDGRLWVANSARGTIVAFDAGQLEVGGAVPPAVLVTPPTGAVTIPTGLAFDAAGALWVVSGDGLLAKYDRTDLSASGAPAASASLRVDDHVLFWSLAFWPKVQALPIN